MKRFNHEATAEIKIYEFYLRNNVLKILFLMKISLTSAAILNFETRVLMRQRMSWSAGLQKNPQEAQTNKNFE